MNYHKPPGIRLLYVICLFASLSLKAQSKIPLREPDLNKPKLFNSLPASMEIAGYELQHILSSASQKNQEISISLAEGKTSAFTGRIADVYAKEKIQTVTVQSTNFTGAVLTLSSVSGTDGTTRYRGRIFSYQHADAFELQTKDNRYYWVKKNLYEMMAE